MTTNQDIVARMTEILDVAERMNSDRATDQAALLATYTQLISTGAINTYVDQENGLDTNEGTEASPFKTITKAMTLTNPFAMNVVRLMNDHTLGPDDQPIVEDFQGLNIQGHGAVRKLIFTGYTDTVNNVTSRQTYGILTRGRMVSITGFNVELVMPERAGVAGLPENTNSPCIRPVNASYPPQLLHVQFNASSITPPASRNGPLLSDRGFQNLMVAGLTANGDMSGLWMADVAAGTATSSLPLVRTNLATF